MIGITGWDLSARHLATLLTLVLLAVCPEVSQSQSVDQQNPCFSKNVVSVPSRPTVSNGADTTQCGVLESEYGLERQWPGGGVHRDDLTGGLRLGLTRQLDFHWASADFLHVSDLSGSHTAFADTWLGVKYRFLEQSKSTPGLGIFYQVKIPAGENLGLSTGKVDHSLSFLVSRDLKPVHVDFNVIALLAGRLAGPGVDHNLGFALSGAVPLKHGFSLVAEGYGYNRLNEDTPGYASAMAGFTYQLNPRLVFDAGFDAGVTHDAPKKRVYVGFTYAIANLYALTRRN